MKIRLYEHPFAVVAPVTYETDSLALWLLGHYGESPKVKVQVFVGEPSAESEITGDVQAIMAGDREEYTILQSPGFEQLIVQVVIMIVAAVATALLTPKPKLPGDVNRSQQSPNNGLGQRENKVRILERVEDIYGTVRSIPSLMMPTYVKYLDNKKYEYGYYCVGRGYHDISDVRDGDTLISDITAACASVYEPFTSPNSGHSPVLQVGDAIVDNVVTASRSIEVDGVVLFASNQVQIEANSEYTFTHHPGGDTITQSSKNPNVNSVCEAGQSIDVTMTDAIGSTLPFTCNATTSNTFEVSSGSTAFDNIIIGSVVAVSGFTVPSNNGVFTVTSKPSSLIIGVAGPLGTETSTTVVFSLTVNYTGSYVIAGVSDGVVTLTTDDWIVPVTQTCTVETHRQHATDWVTLPDEDRTEVWCNVVAPAGLYYDDGGRWDLSVSFTVEIEKLHATTLAPLGIVETASGSLTGKVPDEIADTVEHTTAWTGPARVRLMRDTLHDFDFEGIVQDEVKWTDLYGVSTVGPNHFGNKTTIHTITQATSRATAVKTRQLNCLASRLLPTYNGSTFSGAFDATGAHISGTISATSKICDIIAAVSADPKIGNRDLTTEVDMAQMWSIQGLLDAWNTECGQFNYTFDSDNISFEETVVTIADAGFCVAYRQNGKIRLSFDRASASATALFTHRNKKPKSETITRKFANDAEYDGVEFIYTDPDSNQSETITLPTSGDYTKLKKFEIAGIRSFEQAWLRANREYQKLLGQRVTIETVTTLDARSLLPNSRVDIVDNTRFKSYDGEVVAQNGMVLTLSRDVEFQPSGAHSIVLMKRDGSLQSITVTAGDAPNRVVLSSLPSEAVVTSHGEDGIRTIFSFAADSARGSMAYLVQELDITDSQYCTIKAINYSPDYYSADYTTIPPKATIIN
jgi:hypothetical protein